MESDGELVKDIEESKKDFDAGRYYTLKTDEEKMKKYIGHLIYKTVGTPGFIRRIEWRIMLDWLDPKEGERILDVACGGGVLSLKIAERGCKVYGIDLSVNAINSAKRLAEREKMACKFEVGSAEVLPWSTLKMTSRH
jgi:2-polyprenyl-3-methyl-5-hydroxy-6-metoxy-1,4-benzoquinol methylase